MEGPSLFLAAEQLKSFKGQKVISVSGNTKLEKEIFLGRRVEDIFSWGKHLVFQFDTLAFRVHFLLFGTFEATVEGKSVTGDYKRAYESRLTLDFSNGQIKMFNCSIKLFETNDLKSTYDFSIDIMSPKWNPKKALLQVKASQDQAIADVLLDQEIFAGVGNMIKNEVLSIIKVNPKTRVKDLSETKIKELVNVTQKFSRQFYEWRKEFFAFKKFKNSQKREVSALRGKGDKGENRQKSQVELLLPNLPKGKLTMALYVGTSGWSLQNFYPETVASKDKLVYYAKVFKTVEINSTFYHMPRKTTVEAWQASVPSDFVFTFKVFKGITHFNGENLEATLVKWLETFSGFATGQHLFLFQFPASFAYDNLKLSKLLKLLPDTFLYAFEFRHPSWFIESVYQQILAINGTIVLSDSPLKASGDPVWPKFDLAQAQFTYIRFHGAPKLYSSSYTREMLLPYTDLIQAKLSADKDVYVYFNNDAAGHASENAAEIVRQVK